MKDLNTTTTQQKWGGNQTKQNTRQDFFPSRDFRIFLRLNSLRRWGPKVSCSYLQFLISASSLWKDYGGLAPRACHSSGHCPTFHDESPPQICSRLLPRGGTPATILRRLWLWLFQADWLPLLNGGPFPISEGSSAGFKDCKMKLERDWRNLLGFWFRLLPCGGTLLRRYSDGCGCGCSWRTGCRCGIVVCSRSRKESLWGL